MTDLLARFLHEEDGAEAIEYGLIVSLIILITLAALVNFGGAATNIWAQLATHI